jgi:hypothetical protein
MARASRIKKGNGKKLSGELRPQGRQNTFSGVKLDFLESHKDAFLDCTNRGAFYTFVAKVFIQHFGYNLDFEANPEPGDDEDGDGDEEIDSSLPLEERNQESDQRSKFYHELHDVSGIA